MNADTDGNDCNASFLCERGEYVLANMFGDESILQEHTFTGDIETVING